MRFPALTREFYIHKGSRKIASKTTTAVAYIYETTRDHPVKGQVVRYVFTGFIGKQSRPVADFLYLTEEAREKAVRQFFAAAQVRLAARTERKEKSAKRTAAAVAERQIGDIYVETNSYEMTFNTFYQVVALKGKESVVVREIGSIVVSEHGTFQGQEIPSINSFRKDSKEITKRIVEGRLAIGHRGARKWDGTPCRFNHMD